MGTIPVEYYKIQKGYTITFLSNFIMTFMWLLLGNDQGQSPSDKLISFYTTLNHSCTSEFTCINSPWQKKKLSFFFSFTFIVLLKVNFIVGTSEIAKYKDECQSVKGF